MAGEIIPFGKYKGQPVEVATQDKQYVDWLLAQPWFKERFSNFYTLIVNNFQEPAETPIHNKLQARFLNAAFRGAFLALIFPDSECDETKVVKFEESGFDVALGDSTHWSYLMYVAKVYVECKPTVGDDYPAILRKIKSAGPIELHSRPPRKVDGVNKALFLEEYTGQGASLEDFCAIFEHDGIAVVFLDEVLEALATRSTPQPPA